MNNIPFKRSRMLVLLAFSITGLLLSAPVFADRDGENKHAKNHQKQADYAQNHNSQREYQKNNNQRNDRSRNNNSRVNIYFGEQHRAYIHDYYQERYYAGRCPPGLAKRHNGCVPYGHERRWKKGHTLPRDVIYYDLPPSLVIQLGSPPPRHRFVRVAGDILLIAIGTGLVVDALEDLNNR